MNIDLTKNQFKTLLKLIYCGEWVFNSYKINDDKIWKETDSLEQYIFAFAKEFKLDNWIEYDEEQKKYFPTIEMEENLDKHIQKYNKQQKNVDN